MKKELKALTMNRRLAAQRLAPGTSEPTSAPPPKPEAKKGKRPKAHSLKLVI